MSIWKKFSGLLAPARTDDFRNFWVYVRCDRCQEVIRSRVDLYNDLSAQDGDGKGNRSLFTRKTIMGNSYCFERITVELVFDKDRRLKEKSIEHGQFITEEEYLEFVKHDQNLQT